MPPILRLHTYSKCSNSHKPDTYIFIYVCTHTNTYEHTVEDPAPSRQVEEFRYLRVLFTSEGGQQVDRCGAVSSNEMNFLRMLPVLSLPDKPRTFGIQKKPLLLCDERSQMRWLGHGSGCLPDGSLMKHSGYVPLVGDTREDPGHTGETIVCLSAGLGLNLDPPGSSRVEESPQISRRGRVHV